MFEEFIGRAILGYAFGGLVYGVATASIESVIKKRMSRKSLADQSTFELINKPLHSAAHEVARYYGLLTALVIFGAIASWASLPSYD